MEDGDLDLHDNDVKAKPSPFTAAAAAKVPAIQIED